MLLQDAGCCERYAHRCHWAFAHKCQEAGLMPVQFCSSQCSMRAVFLVQGAGLRNQV